MTGFIVTKLDAAIYGWCKTYDCPFFEDFKGGKVVDGKDPDQIATAVVCNIKSTLGCGKVGTFKSCPRAKIFRNYAETYIALYSDSKLHAIPQEQADLMRKIEKIYSEYATEEETAELNAMIEETNKV